MQNLQLIPANGARKEHVTEVTVSYHDFFSMGHRLVLKFMKNFGTFKYFALLLISKIAPEEDGEFCACTTLKTGADEISNSKYSQ